MDVKFTQASRRHRLGRANIKRAMASEPIFTSVNERGETEYLWVAADTRGLGIEVVAVETVDQPHGRANPPREARHAHRVEKGGSR